VSEPDERKNCCAGVNESQRQRETDEGKLFSVVEKRGVPEGSRDRVRSENHPRQERKRRRAREEGRVEVQSDGRTARKALRGWVAREFSPQTGERRRRA